MMNNFTLAQQKPPSKIHTETTLEIISTKNIKIVPNWQNKKKEVKKKKMLPH